MSSIQNQDEISIYLMNQICDELPNSHNIDASPNNITSMIALLEIYKATSNQKLKFLIDQLFSHTGGSWSKLLKKESDKKQVHQASRMYRGNPVNASEPSENQNGSESHHTKPQLRMYRGTPVKNDKQNTDDTSTSTLEESHQTKKQRIYRGNIVDT